MHPLLELVPSVQVLRGNLFVACGRASFEMWLVASIGESKAQMFGEAGVTAASQSPCIR